MAHIAKSYLMLLKPGIVMGNAITCAGGFALASRGQIDYSLLLLTLFGLSLVVASGCVSNNYIDRNHDGKMARTKNRGLVSGVISPRQALVFALFLLLGGIVLLFLSAGLLTVLISLFGFVVYLIFYSFSKYHTVHATLIGSIAGAMPPVVGYTAVCHSLDTGAFILFLMIAMWQMPHFYAIAMYRLEEYASASIPVLPVVKGMQITKVHMLLYIIGFLAISFLLPLFKYVDAVYFIIVALLGVLWLWLCVNGFKCIDDKVWARKMFFCSLAVIMGVCFVIPFSVIK